MPLFAIPLLGQSGGQFEIRKSVIPNGGGALIGGSVQIDGTVGQPIAGGAMIGGTFSIESGFWTGDGTPTPTSTPTASPTGTPTASPTATPTATPTAAPATVGIVSYLTPRFPSPLPGGPPPVPNVLLTATNGTNTVTATTGANGAYSLSGFVGTGHTVTPSRQPYLSFVGNGIFSNDASLISRHIVGLDTLSPDQIKAGRVAGFPQLTSFDASLIAQFIVGIQHPMNQTGRWVFTPESTAPDVTVNNIQDYRATLMGDPSGDWNPAGPRPMLLRSGADNSGAVKVSLGPPYVQETRGEVTVPLQIANLDGRAVDSFQFDVEYDPDAFEPNAIPVELRGTAAAPLTAVWNSPVKGLLKVVVYGAATVTGDGVYAELNFRERSASGSVSSRLRLSNFYLGDPSTDVQLVQEDDLSIIPLTPLLGRNSRFAAFLSR